ncbi:MAG: efflux RND transporter periplasmic adaptor subunit [Syntrophorhabdales bacterium]|jgi:Cu(I)/Ag(I) efflux system membrane fusion protein
MKRWKPLAIAAFLIVALAFIVYLSKPAKHPTNPVPAPAAAEQEKPGAMAGMPGMAAEKPSAQKAPAEEAQTEAPTVEILPEKQRMIGVKTIAAAVLPLTKTIRTVGLVEYDQRRLKTITTKIEGWVEKLYVNFTGTFVRKGDPVADIYSPELWATQQEFINVVKWAKGAGAKGGAVAGPTTDGRAGYPLSGSPDIRAMIDRDAQSLVEAARQRLKLFDISDSQIKRIEESERPIRTLTINSPYSGYVLQKNVNQGSRVMAGADLFDVADLSSVWITADIYEYEMPLVRVGDTAVVQLSYFPGRQFTTRIDYIYPTLQGETRTAKARFTLPNEGGRLKPQMFTNVELKIALGRRLAVPTDAVINTGVRQVVYVDRGEGIFEPREVVTGVRTDSLVEVTAGLSAGEKVASSANFLIDSEAKLKGVEPLPRKASKGSTQ